MCINTWLRLAGITLFVVHKKGIRLLVYPTSSMLIKFIDLMVGIIESIFAYLSNA